MEITEKMANFVIETDTDTSNVTTDTGNLQLLVVLEVIYGLILNPESRRSVPVLYYIEYKLCFFLQIIQP